MSTSSKNPTSGHPKGIELKALRSLSAKISAKKLSHMYFPKGIADGEIKEILEEDEYSKLVKIVLTNKGKRAYFFEDDHRVQLRAIDKILKLYGLYAPKRKAEAAEVNKPFSLSSLRKDMKLRHSISPKG